MVFLAGAETRGMRAAALAAGGGRRAPEGRGDPRDYRERLGVIVWPGAADGAGRRAGLLACDESARVVQQSRLVDEPGHGSPKLGPRRGKVKSAGDRG